MEPESALPKKLFFTERINEDTIIFSEYIKNLGFNYAEPIEEYINLSDDYWMTISNLGQFMVGDSKDTHRQIIANGTYMPLIGIFSAMRLIDAGLTLASYPILRNAYESLMISKSVSIFRDPKLVEKWDKNRPIYLSNDVFRAISSSKSEMLQFWGVLSDSTHATSSSMQPGLIFGEFEKIFDITLDFIFTLCCCHHHLLTQHYATRSHKYFLKYAVSTDRSLPHELRLARLNELVTAMYSSIGRPCKKVVAEYRANWKRI